MHTQRRYATCSKGMSEKKEKNNNKDAYPNKVCHMLKRMSKKRNKDVYPKKVCHMPTRHVKKREKKRER